MSTVTRGLTYDDLLKTPEDSNRYEIIDGDLVVSPAPVPLHQQISIRLTLLIGNFVLMWNLGQIFTAPVDVRLSPHNIVEPDLLFIRQDRLGIIGPTLIEGAPDLVVEILSPGSRARDLGRKRTLYAEAGVPEYWVVDPAARSLSVFVLRDGGYQAVAPVDGALTSEVLPGLSVEPAALFAGL